MTSIFFVRIFSALSMLGIFTLYREDQQVLDSINKTLIFIAFLDFGMQQTAVMKYLNSKKLMILEVALVVVVICLFGYMGILNYLSSKLILLAYLINIIQAVLYRNGQIKIVPFLVLARVISLILLIELQFSVFFIFPIILVIFLFIEITNNDKNTSFSYLQKRFELGIIATTAVFNEQLIRFEAGLDYDLSILLLSLGYIISFVSIGQQTLLQYFYVDKSNNSIDHLVNIKSLFVLMTGSLIALTIVMEVLAIEQDQVRYMIYLMVISNLSLRYSLLIDNVKDKSLKEYIVLNIIVLMAGAFLINEDISLFTIQIVVSILILLFTSKKIIWNTYK